MSEKISLDSSDYEKEKMVRSDGNGTFIGGRLFR